MLGVFMIVLWLVVYLIELFGLWIIDLSGVLLVYSGDIGICDQFVELVCGVDVFFCEVFWIYLFKYLFDLYLLGIEVGMVVV